MEIHFNIISKLRYSKTKITLITIVYGLLTFILPILFVIFTPFNVTTTGIISISLLIILFILSRPIENSWLYRTSIIDKAVITKEFIKLKEEEIYWDSLRDIEIKKYIKYGLGNNISTWKFSYFVRFICLNEEIKTLYISKFSIDDKKHNFINVILGLNKINKRIRAKCKQQETGNK
ncbi:MAG: hypothetical protein K9J13_13735 [Saprospiraceae bacterium]|nr:hypothetical protein [Saprospiraceae bacterium]